MNRIILLLAAFFSIHQSSVAQTSNGQMLFVIDSIPVLFDPQPMNDLWEEDIATWIVVKNDKGLQLPGLSNIDSITYIFTKEWVNRPDSLKQLPSLKQLEIKDSVWNLYGAPYTGKYVDYYYSGREQTEGSLLNGKKDGQEVYYFQSGQVGRIKNYKNGKQNGPTIHYYKNGKIQSKAYYINDRFREAEAYYPNGMLESRTTAPDSTGSYGSIWYLSTGKVKQVFNYNINGKYEMDSTMHKSIIISKKLEQIKTAANRKMAKKITAEVIELDSANTDAYRNLGFFMLYRNHFNDAIDAYDKAIEIEPFLFYLLVDRAQARIRKYESKHPRQWVKKENSERLVLNPVDIKSIRAAEKEKICDDLNRADSWQNIYTYHQFLVEISKTYCGMDVRR